MNRPVAPPVDLRSDTVTKPSAPMRTAMASAEVGDDVYGEDPTTRTLEERSAELLGKQAAMFVTSGTAANQIALMLHCRAGDEVIVGDGAHNYFYECGAGAALAGVQFAVAGQGGLFTAEEADAVSKPRAYYLPRTRLVSVENTHNRAGGRVFPQREIQRICAFAAARGFATHLDGARLWNAAVATGLSMSELAAPFDTVSVCFSKGLGAPVGSVLLGTRAAIEEARRFRKMLGGGMRQVGIIAAGALYALNHNVKRIGDDHRRAKTLAAAIAELPNATCDTNAVETNIVNFDVHKADDWVLELQAHGLLLNAIDPGRIRAVTHLDIGDEELSFAIDALRQVSHKLSS